MLKVFLVEDESVVRESLRDNIPWKEYGFSFVGEASDGEVALPLIRKTAPDVLITDIKMPFMDGLSLSHIVKKEFPSMRIVIMSGYDDFEYAKRAIKEGVDQYISKPITKSGMKEVLDSVKEKIEKERTQQGYLMQYQMETQEYEQLQRREFFEKVLTGTMPVKDIYVEAGKLSLDITASAFSLILFSIKDKEKPFEEIGSVQYCRALEELMSYFLRFPAYILSRWSLNTYIVIVKGEKDIVADYVEKGVSKITEICEDKDDKIEWYVSAGKPVERFSALVKCFNQVSHAFACRYFVQDTHILTEETTAKYTSAQNDGSIENIDSSKVDSAVIKGFLSTGTESEIGEFVSEYLSSLGDALKSHVFRNFFVLNSLFAASSFLEASGVTGKDIDENLFSLKDGYEIKSKQLSEFMTSLLKSALELRDGASNRRGNKLISDAIAYIDENYMNESCTLVDVAEALSVNSSYLSTVFSKEMDTTCVKFLTAKRLEKARELLAKKRMHTADVAAAVGYKDSHYFSFVFRKMYGMSPREYRNQNS